MADFKGTGVSGIYGNAKANGAEVLEFLKWDADFKCNVTKYSSNKTQGWEAGVSGKQSGTGSIEGVFDPANPPTLVMHPGAKVKLELFSTATQKYTGMATLEGFKTAVDRDSGAHLVWTVSFSTDGPWEFPAAQTSMTYDPSKTGDDAPVTVPSGEDRSAFKREIVDEILSALKGVLPRAA